MEFCWTSPGSCSRKYFSSFYFERKKCRDLNTKNEKVSVARCGISSLDLYLFTISYQYLPFQNQLNIPLINLILNGVETR